MSISVDIYKDLGAFKLRAQFEAENEVLGLLGASGCGKSMTLRCIAGIVNPDRGRIVLDGKTLFDSEKKINLRPQQREVGLLFQNYALFPNMTVEQNIMTGLKREKDRQEKKRICAEMIEKLQLTGLEKHRPSQLSGGQQQRVALARILVSKPNLIMLDEPFSALDSYLRWQTEMEISDLLGEFSATALFVSHDRDEIYRVCDKLCVINSGKSEDVIDARELFSNPGSISAALLSGCKNYSRIEKIDDTHISALDWNATLAVKGPVMDEHAYVGVRSHLLRPCDPRPGGNVIWGGVSRIVEDSLSTTVMLDTGCGTDYSKIMVELDKSEATPGGQACVLAQPEDIMLLRA